MAKKQEAVGRGGKKRREVPAKVVESESDSEESDSDDGVMGDEFEGLSEEVEERDGFVVDSEEEEEEMAEGSRRLMGRITDAGGFGSEEEEGSMEGSRSRSEEDLRDIGSARRLDDDDTGDSAWKEGVAEVDVAGQSESLKESGGDGAVARGVESEEEGEEAEAMETDDEEEEEEEEEAGSGESEGEPSGSVSLEDGSDSDIGSGGKGDKSENATSSAYSRAFSKILQQSKVAKESETVRKVS